MLNILQKDALTEYFNVAIGHAASILSELAGEKVQLTVPKVDYYKVGDLNKLETILSFKEKGHIVSSSIKFSNEIKGKATLFLPTKESKQLINVFLNEEYIIDSEYNNLTSVDIDAIMEIGNLLLNAIMGGFANLLNVSLAYQPPEVELINELKIRKNLFAEGIESIFVIHNTFLLKTNKIMGTILVALSVSSSVFLLSKIDELVSDLL